MRWPWVVAVVLGGWLALWLLGGDRDPDASDELTITVLVHQHDTYDFAGTEFYELTSGQNSFVLSIDRHLPLAQWLRGHERQRVALTMTGRGE